MSTTHHESSNDHGLEAAHGADLADDLTGLPDGPVGVSVRHDVRVPAVVSLVCAVLTVVWFARALATSDALDWAMTVVPAAVGVLMLALLRDARAPLLVADDEGVRVRRGAAWTGLRWSDVDSVEIRSRRGTRDGALVLHLADTTVEGPVEGQVEDDEEVTPSAAGAEVSVPLGVGTRVEVEGLTGNLVEDLASLAAGRVPVRVIAAPVELPVELPKEELAPREDLHDDEYDGQDDSQDDGLPDGGPVDPAHDEAVEQDDRWHEVVEPEQDAAVVSERFQVTVLPSGVDADELPEQVGPQDAADAADAADVADVADVADEDLDAVAPAEPYVAGLEPDRPTRSAARSEVVREGARRAIDPPVIPAQRGADAVVTARIEDVAVETGPQPAADPVIGPVVAAARERARLSIDTLSERTRIRPHVLECIEVDDFAPCGGDFYARGHLRTLARIFGLDADELVATYDARYAQPEIEAKQVFEAELASGVGGGLRTASTGPRWSLLAAAVVLLVGIWGTARVFADSPQELVSPAPAVVDTAGLAGKEPEQPKALAAIRVTAQGASPQVVVRDASGQILWAGKLGEGASQQVIGTGPFDVTASNGAAVRVDYLGKDRGTVGDSEAADNRRFG